MARTPYTNFHDLNLNWIIEKIKTVFTPDNPPPYPVTSVNQKTGAVELKGTDIPVSANDSQTIDNALASKYEKPASGIPASDLAPGVIPDPASVIDDNAGSQVYDKTWSAHKLFQQEAEIVDLQNDKQDTPASAGTAGQVLGLNSSLQPEWVDMPEAQMLEAVDDWLSENITNPSNPPLDRSLSLANACAPADMVGAIQNALGNGYCSVEYNTRYPYVSVPVPASNKLYIDLKSITGTVTSVVVRGAVGDTLTTEATLTLDQLPKIITISGSGYDSIRVYFNLSAVNTGTIIAQIIQVTDSYNNISERVFSNYKNIFDNECRSNCFTGNLYDDVKFTAGTLSHLNYLKSDIFNYKTYYGPQSYGSQVSDPIVIRKSNGELFANIYFCIPESLGNGVVAYSYDADGNPANEYDATNISTFPQSNDYYLVLYNYHSNVNLRAVYDKNKQYVYEVGTGKAYTSFYQCMKEIAKNPYQKIVNVYAGEYDLYSEIGGDTYANTIISTDNWANVNILVPTNTHIIGHGNVILKMIAPNMPNTASSKLAPINTRGGVVFENITIIGSNVHYCIHVEGSNLSDFDELRTVFRNVNIIRENATTGARNNGTMIGVGLNKSCDLIFENCKCISKCNYIVYFMHTNDNGSSPTVKFINTIIDTEYLYSINLGVTGGESNLVPIDFNNCYVSGTVIKALTSGITDTNDIYEITALNTNEFTVSVGNHVLNEIETERY